MLTESDQRMLRGMAGKVLLRFIESLHARKIMKMQASQKRIGHKIERQAMPKETAHKANDGPVRTRTGYVYR